jgi:hypothetical protein
MTSGHGYKAKFDYVELTVERRDDHWRLILTDNKHRETVEHEKQFANSAEAQDAALALAKRHIYDQHNDTLLARSSLAWTEY